MSSSGVDLAASKSTFLEDLLWDEKKKVLCWQKTGQESGGSDPFSHNLPRLYFPSLFVVSWLETSTLSYNTRGWFSQLPTYSLLAAAVCCRFFVPFHNYLITRTLRFFPIFSSFSFCFSRWGPKLYSAALCVHLKNHPKDLSPINTMHWDCFDFWYFSHDRIRNGNKNQSSTKNSVRGSRRWKNGAHIRGENLCSCWSFGPDENATRGSSWLYTSVSGIYTSYLSEIYPTLIICLIPISRLGVFRNAVTP